MILWKKEVWHQENPNKEPPESDIQNIDGKDTEGYWVKMGPRGHHKFRKYEDRGVEQRTLRRLESTGCDVDTHLKKQLICFSLQVENEKKRPKPRSVFTQDCESGGRE